MTALRAVFGLTILAAGIICANEVRAGAATECADPDALGVSRTVEIDTTGGPGFGLEHYKANDFLQPKEVILTFDDGPQKFTTEAVLAALAAQCTKATFFSVGKMALGYPDIIRAVANAGHTVGTHTWSHKPIRKLKTFEEGKDEIERGISAVRRAVGGPIAPFFRYPTLVDTKESLEHLGKRNIAMFSTDIDSFDFKIQSPENMVKTTMAKLDKYGKGIVLMHDIHKTTAKAVPLLLAALKKGGYRIVHMKAKDEVVTLAEFDAAIEKDAKGLPQTGSDRPVSAIVKTIEGEVPEAEKAAAPAAPAPDVSPAKAEPAPQPDTGQTPERRSELDPPDAARAPDLTEAAAAPAPAPGTMGADAATPATAAPVTTAAVSEAGAVEAPAGGEAVKPGDAAKSWSTRAVEIWELWFGK